VSGRGDPFATLKEEMPAFEVKPKKQAAVAEEAIEQISRENNFPSRQAPKAPVISKRRQRRYRTGRNRQLSIKTTDATAERFIKAADDREMPYGQLLAIALDALDRAGESR
jgi:hypothetical protein